MLNAKTLRKLVIITAVCAVPVVLIALKSGVSAIKDKNALFMPDLLKKSDQITKVILQDHTLTLTLQKIDGNWQMAERNNYPVLREKVEELLFSLADLRIVEPKTSNRELYSQLDVNDIAENDSQALLITVQNSQSENLAKLYIGKREGVRLGEEYQEHIFVRRVNEEQTWLVQGIVPLSNDFRDWVEQPLLGVIESDQIKSVEIQQPQAAKIVISKLKQDQEDFVLETLAAKKGMVLDLDAVNTVPFEIAELEFTDVQLAAETTVDWDKSLTAVLETFPGVKVVLNLVKQNDKILARVQANAEANAPADLQQKVQAYNETKKSWVYELSPEYYKALSLANDDFLKPKEMD